ncbi:hypothetical protein FGO68_gene8247 [Halteria grandinella]|uniref:Uncharacterized protein n=1 Tax=Halteria grandinella TaxID=5974 RepID=A0A8J8SZK4_HALGN|nr:hypothetical protein FGO68_gene8247 [Halteria grandinella]
MYCYIICIVVSLYWVKRYITWKNCDLRAAFEGKVAFITGGSSGIGEALTKELVRLGAKKVVIASRNVAEMERVKKQSAYPDRVDFVQMDLSKPKEAMEKATEYINKSELKNTGVDFVFNNAGLTMRDEFINTDFATCEYMLNTNLLSHIGITKAFLPLMQSKKRGHFVNVVSIAGLVGTAFRTMYSAAKFGTAGFFKALRSEVKSFGVSVTNVYPEFVKTNVSINAVLGQGQKFGKTDTNIQNGITTERAVNEILKGVALGDHEVIVGRFQYRVLPLLCFLSTTFNSFLGSVLYKKTKDSIMKAQ